MTAPDLSGRTALVTGSAKGIGRELLLAIADCGADVAVNYRSSADDAAAVADRAREAGVEATTVQGDVTDPDSVDGMFAAVEDELRADHFEGGVWTADYRRLRFVAVKTAV